MSPRHPRPNQEQAPHRESGTAMRAELRHYISHYLTTRRKAEHISAVSLCLEAEASCRLMTRSGNGCPRTRPGATSRSGSCST
jgi:hypothetical protein